MLAGLGCGFNVLSEGTYWNGQFAYGAPLLFDNGPGFVTLTFDTGVSAFTLSAQADNYGAFTGMLMAYSGTSLVGTATANWFN